MSRRSFGLTCALTVIGGTVMPKAVQAQTAVVRLATTPTDSGAQIFYAADLGLFAKAGLDVRINVIGLGATIPQAVLGGSIDIATTATPVLVSAHLHNLPFVIIAPGGEYSSKNPTSELVVNATSTIRNAADLTGKTVGVNGLKSITQVAVQAWLDKNGGNSKLVKYYELPFGVMPAAIQTGRIDAVFIAEPFLSQVLASGGRIIGHAYDGIAPNFMINPWFCTTDYAKANPDIVRKFAQAVIAAGTWANAHPAESAVILEKYTKTPVARNMVRVTYGERVTDAVIQPVIDVSAKYGVIDKPFPASELLAP